VSQNGRPSLPLGLKSEPECQTVSTVSSVWASNFSLNGRLECTVWTRKVSPNGRPSLPFDSKDGIYWRDATSARVAC
jgi:hypothetical protein